MSSATLKMELMKSDINVADSKQQQQQHFHVLAVDDSLLDRKLLERLLRGSSYKVTCVDSGDEALKYLGLLDDLNQHSIPNSSNSSTTSSQSSELEGSKVINLIMTDYCMPGMSGYDLLKRVKGSSLKNVPVVVMSSENVPSRINMCLEGGAEEFFLKPLQISDLKKLQPYVVKSQLEHSNCNNNNNNNNDNNTKLIVSEEIGETSIDQNKSSTTTTENIKGNINNNISISKRKAVVSPQTSERRPKMKGLAVV